MKKLTYKKGFTLIELLVVIAIMGVLSGIVLQALKSTKSKTRDTQRAEEIRSLKIALHDYYNDSNGGNGAYPPSQMSGPYPFSGYLDILVPKYISRLPTDPLSSPYNYMYYRPGPNLYGIRVWSEKNNAFCKTGVNMVDWWWGSAPQCPF